MYPNIDTLKDLADQGKYVSWRDVNIDDVLFIENMTGYSRFTIVKGKSKEVTFDGEIQSSRLTAICVGSFPYWQSTISTSTLETKMKKLGTWQNGRILY